MTDTTGSVFFDACTLENFSAVGRLDLLSSLYGDRCAWMTAVVEEIQVRVAVRPDLRDIDKSWLGEPLDTDCVQAMQRVDRIRRALGGQPNLPKHHLGEAQIIEHLESTGRGTFATDDADAALMAKNRGLNVVDTFDIVAACYEAGLIGCPDAFHLLVRMRELDRGVHVPPNHWYICPPPQ